MAQVVQTGISSSEKKKQQNYDMRFKKRKEKAID